MRFQILHENAGRLRLRADVRSMTLEQADRTYFPDAPTERGVKHIRELIKARKHGYRCGVAFVIQMNGVKEVRPNIETHPEFGEALAEAEQAGVKVLCLECEVRKESLRILSKNMNL